MKDTKIDSPVRRETNADHAAFPTRLPFNGAISPNMLLHPAPGLAALYCESRDVPIKQFEAKLFTEALFPHARMLRLPLRLFSRDIFESDHEFIRQVGQVQSLVEYVEAENAFRRRITHFSGFRRTFKLRVSTRRIRRIVESFFREDVMQ